MPATKTKKNRKRRWQQAKEDYTLKDMKYVLSRNHGQDWTEVMHWIEETGEAKRHLAPGKRKALAGDLQKLAGEDVPFTMNHVKAFHLAHQFREM